MPVDGSDRDVTLLFTATDGPVSQWVRYWCRSDVSHVALGWSRGGDRVVLDADFGGVRLRDRAAFLRGVRLVAEYRALPDLGARAAALAALVGTPYDYAGLVGHNLVAAARRLGLRLGNPLASRRGLVCSELVRRLDLAGEHLPEWAALPVDLTTPADLLAACAASPRFVRVDPAG